MKELSITPTWKAPEDDFWREDISSILNGKMGRWGKFIMGKVQDSMNNLPEVGTLGQYLAWH